MILARVGLFLAGSRLLILLRVGKLAKWLAVIFTQTISSIWNFYSVVTNLSRVSTFERAWNLNHDFSQQQSTKNYGCFCSLSVSLTLSPLRLSISKGSRLPSSSICPDTDRWLRAFQTFRTWRLAQFQFHTKARHTETHNSHERRT